MVASLIQADLLVLASDIDGLYTKNPHLHADAELITSVTDLTNLNQFIEERQNGLGTGGMTSKLIAVEICFKTQIDVILVNGARPNFFSRLYPGKHSLYPF